MLLSVLSSMEDPLQDFSFIPSSVYLETLIIKLQKKLLVLAWSNFGGSGFFSQKARAASMVKDIQAIPKVVKVAASRRFRSSINFSKKQ